MASPTTLLNQSIIRSFPGCSCSSHFQIESVKSSALRQFPTSNRISPPRFFPGGAVSRKTGCWSPSPMTGSSDEAYALRGRDGDGDEGGPTVFEQEALLGGFSGFRARFMAEGLEASLNRLSKWIVSAVFGAIILCRHDLVAVWFAGGAVLNSYLSKILKRILNQERPVANLRSDPGMPSSHAQSIFYISTFAIISFLELLGLNGYTILASGVTLAFASYFTWLRVSQRLHTASQVTVGAVLGTIICVLWYWSWQGIVMEAFESLLWVRVLVIVGATAFCLSFILYVLRNWFRDER